MKYNIFSIEIIILTHMTVCAIIPVVMAFRETIRDWE